MCLCVIVFVCVSVFVRCCVGVCLRDRAERDEKYLHKHSRHTKGQNGTASQYIATVRAHVHAETRTHWHAQARKQQTDTHGRNTERCVNVRRLLPPPPLAAAAPAATAAAAAVDAAAAGCWLCYCCCCCLFLFYSISARACDVERR